MDQFLQGVIQMPLVHSAKASAEASTAVGNSTKASGISSTATGFNAEASGNFSSAYGNDARAKEIVQ